MAGARPPRHHLARWALLALACALPATAWGQSAPLLRRSADRTTLTDSAGNPVLIWGEAAWTLNTQLRPAQQNAYLDDRASRGINAIGLQLISRYQDTAPDDYDGVPPFTVPDDFATFNPQYFARAADLVGRAGARGMTVFIAPCWAGYDAQQGWNDTMVANGPDKSFAYGVAVAKVFAKYDNVVWLMGGDKPGDFSTDELAAMAAGIRSIDTRHLMTAHWSFSPSDRHPGIWEDIASCYDWNGGVSYPQIQGEYDERDAPVILLEALYELNYAFGSTEQILRAQSIMALLSGAKGSFFGHEGVWHLGGEGWNLPSQSQGAPYDLDSVGMRHQQNIHDFFINRPWAALVPSLDDRLITEGRGGYGGSDFVGAALTPDGRLAVAYFPGAHTITVDTRAISLPATARWFDPTNARYKTVGTYSSPGLVEISSPGLNDAGDDDWLLVLEAATAQTGPSPVPASRPLAAAALLLAIVVAGAVRLRRAV